jgi:hypothetical protein
VWADANNHSRQRPSALSKLCIQIVSPPLHHDCALLQILRVIVGRGHFIALHVGKLRFNVRLIEPTLVGLMIPTTVAWSMR